MGFEVPYQHGGNQHRYIPDFIVLVDDGRGEDDLLQLIVEIKGYRNEQAKTKRLTMDTYWVPGVNNSKRFGRWAFAEFTDIFSMPMDLEDEIRKHQMATELAADFDKLITGIIKGAKDGA
jgi:type III restriction enzyme